MHKVGSVDRSDPRWGEAFANPLDRSQLYFGCELSGGSAVRTKFRVLISPEIFFTVGTPRGGNVPSSNLVPNIVLQCLVEIYAARGRFIRIRRKTTE